MHILCREIVVIVLGLLRQGSAYYLQDTSDLERIYLSLGRDTLLGIACGYILRSSPIRQLSVCKEVIGCGVSGFIAQGR
jgi:hypothetical protein